MIAAGFDIYAIAIPALLLVLLAGAEIVWPRRKLVLGRSPRWRTHALFFATNAVVGRLLSFLVVVGGAAHWASTHHFGVLNPSASLISRFGFSILPCTVILFYGACMPSTTPIAIWM
jgi:hypothetical protein